MAMPREYAPHINNHLKNRIYYRDLTKLGAAFSPANSVSPLLSSSYITPVSCLIRLLSIAFFTNIVYNSEE